MLGIQRDLVGAQHRFGRKTVRFDFRQEKRGGFGKSSAQFRQKDRFDFRQEKEEQVMGCTRDWALLPLELLIIIASRIECLEDLVAFSAVCPLWNAAYCKAKSLWKPKMPWLMLAEDQENNPKCLRTVFDPATKNQYRMELPETFGRYCHGCGDGWVLTLGIDMEFHLFNPHTKARLSLPPVKTLPFLGPLLDFDKPRVRPTLRANLITKVTLLKTHSSSELVVVLVYAESFVAFAKPGDSSWRGSEGFSPELEHVRDVVQCRDSAMVVYQDGTVAAFDVDSFFLADPSPREGKVYEPAQDPGWSESHYVNSGGDLLALEEHYNLDDPAIGALTIHYYVFKFDFKAKEWKRIHELGDVAIFVGNNTSISLRASESAFCRPDCIYFTESRSPSGEIKVVGKDIGVFCLEDYFVDDELYEGDGAVTSEFCPPFWYTPKLV